MWPACLKVGLEKPPLGSNIRGEHLRMTTTLATPSNAPRWLEAQNNHRGITVTSEHVTLGGVWRLLWWVEGGGGDGLWLQGFLSENAEVVFS